MRRSLIPPRLLSAATLLCFLAGQALAAAPAPAASSLSEPLQLISVFPRAGAKEVCIDSQFRLTFSSPPSPTSTGTIQLFDASGKNLIASIDASASTQTTTIGGLSNFNYFPLLPDGNDIIIDFHTPLAYGKEYQVQITGNPFADSAGKPISLQPLANWHFTTKSTAPVLPATGPRRITIAADGSGDFATLQGALDFVRDNNTVPTTLFLRNGTYHEMVYFAKKDNLTILGEDRKKTVLAYPANQNLNNTDRSGIPGGYRRGLLRAVNTAGLVIANLTLHNTTPHGGGQAEAVILNGGPNARTILTGVDLESFQDTLQINGQGYVSDSYIEGDVDFMWGTGPVYFENCDCKAVSKNAYYTQIRNTAANHGYVYDHCVFEGSPDVSGAVLSRIDATRFPASEVVLLNCTLTDALSAAGWRFDRGGENPAVHFWEFNSRDPAGNAIDDSHRLAGSRRLASGADAQTIADYSHPAWVLGNHWTPALAPIITAQPAAASDGSLAATAVGVPSPAFQWQKDGVDIAGAAANRFTPSSPGTYRVRISNAAGTITSNPAIVPSMH